MNGLGKVMLGVAGWLLCATASAETMAGVSHYLDVLNERHSVIAHETITLDYSRDGSQDLVLFATYVNSNSGDLEERVAFFRDFDTHRLFELEHTLSHQNDEGLFYESVDAETGLIALSSRRESGPEGYMIVLDGEVTIAPTRAELWRQVRKSIKTRAVYSLSQWTQLQGFRCELQEVIPFYGYKLAKRHAELKRKWNRLVADEPLKADAVIKKAKVNTCEFYWQVEDMLT
ncbi:hypothetical protein A6E01_20635 (plasmid) [Vibrio breoganii]|uniref:Uncharacterized protein n=1 Tax=Vibrio breoganii TaxID=553239 RepID=A0AAN0XZR9_9VIBR|nr:hypothetical protein [Vibrio breoganii]ANO35620.1 hypothetical protein A6E01_20635 [Vibrio breoganii]